LENYVRKIIVALAAPVMALGIGVAASAPAQAASITKSCSTGGLSYMTDTMYVTQTKLGTNSYSYKMTRSANRTLTVNISGTYHYVKHTATAFNQYSGSTVFKKSYPATSLTVYSQRSTDDFGIWYNVSDGSTMNVTKGCYIYF
jgi:hypothetical protein